MIILVARMMILMMRMIILMARMIILIARMIMLLAKMIILMVRIIAKERPVPGLGPSLGQDPGRPGPWAGPALRGIKSTQAWAPALGFRSNNMRPNMEVL